jgi:curli production assembly/transport component CsgG
MMQIIGVVILAIFLSSCATQDGILEPAPASISFTPLKAGLRDFSSIKGNPVVVAVYSFKDLTGQRKPADNIANLSSAVTQGAEVYLIKALMDISDGKFFKVVERGGLEALIKERQLIRNTRQSFEGEKAKQLSPLKFAGIMVEGGVVGYDSNKQTGGAGIRLLGIGPQTEWRMDVVTVGLRVISVLTGEVLLTVTTEKTILSCNVGLNVFKFYDAGTKVLEVEAGTTTNEPVNYAVRQAIETAVIEMVKEGRRKKLWDYAHKTVKASTGGKENEKE